MTEEEGGFIEELCAGFYTGFNFVALPDLSVTSDPEILCREYLEALSYHRFVFAPYLLDLVWGVHDTLPYKTCQGFSI